jgi:pyruvate/2-oxoglutarate dehydrogenase complex dihydrolipoamide acyltransferase (E2) component
MMRVRAPTRSSACHSTALALMGDTRRERDTRSAKEQRTVAKVTMPQLGESVAEGTIGKWLKQPGDHVDKYEPLLEVITDKVNAEVPSPFEGVLKEILAEEGATVPNNAEIAIIETGDDAGSGDPATAPPAAVGSDAPTASEAKSSATEAKSSATEAAAPVARDEAGPSSARGPAGSDESNASERAAATASTAASPAAAAAAPMAAAPAASTAPLTATGDPDARMTPAVRRLLREHALRAEQIVGTGGGGRIKRDDVLAVVEAIRTGATPPVAVMGQNGSGATSAGTSAPPSAAAPPTPPAPSSRPTQLLAGSPITFPEGTDEVLLPMTQMRKGIAAQMTRALQVPHAYVHMEVDVTALVKLREGAKRDYQAREGISLSYVPFVIKATVDGLRRFPAFNAHWTDDGILAKRRVNMGVAVAVDEGLIVPVVRDVDQLSISGLNRAIADVAARARAGKFKVDDFGGGTFTIDNTGWFGSNLTMPIINVPEVAILTMEAITKRPVVQETPDGDVIAIRPVMNMVLAIDHRANDGAQAAALLKAIKTWLESVGPETPIY